MTADDPSDRRARRSAAAAALVIANLAIAAIVLARDWAYYAVLIAFWLELLIIGFYNIGRIITVFLAGNPFGTRVGLGAGTRLLGALLAAGFFAVKYGSITLGAGLWVLGAPTILSPESVDRTASLLAGLQSVGPGLGIAALTLFISHGVSFGLNFIGRGEYRQARILGLLFWPYARVMGTVAVLFGAYVAATGLPGLERATTFILVLLATKLVLDLVTHWLEHGAHSLP